MYNRASKNADKIIRRICLNDGHTTIASLKARLKLPRKTGAAALQQQSRNNTKRQRKKKKKKGGGEGGLNDAF